MSKHKKHSSASEHKAENSKIESKKDSKVLGFELNTILLIAALVIATAIVSTWAGFGVAQSQFAQQEKVNLDLVDSTALKLEVEDYINANLLGQEGVLAKITGATEISVGLFEMPFEIYENESLVSQGSVYANKNKVFLVQAAFDLNTPLELPVAEEEPVEVAPKSDKPVVELFVWGYCPYGVQSQGPLVEVANLLSEEADFIIVPYYDGHGAFETQQNKIQLCVQELYPEKYWSYADGFVKEVYPKCSVQRTVECDATESEKIMSSLGIDSKEVMSCVESQGEELFMQAQTEADLASVQGSPTLVINGAKINVARTADAMKNAVCEAFNSVPQDCLVSLSGSGSASPEGTC